MPNPRVARGRKTQELLAVAHPDWTEQAVCRSTDAELWFPEKGCSDLAAKRICAACPVQTECLAYALDVDDQFGIWGGLSPRERRRLTPGFDREYPRRVLRHGTEGGYRTHLRRGELPCEPCTVANRQAAARRKADRAEATA